MKSPEEFVNKFAWSEEKCPGIDEAKIEMVLVAIIKRVKGEIAQEESIQRVIENRPPQFEYDPKDPFSFDTQREMHLDRVRISHPNWNKSKALEAMGYQKRIVPDAATLKKYGEGTYVLGLDGQPEKINEEEYVDFGNEGEDDEATMDEPAMIFGTVSREAEKDATDNPKRNSEKNGNVNVKYNVSTKQR